MLFSKISKRACHDNFIKTSAFLHSYNFGDKKKQNNDFPVFENILPDILSLCALSLPEKEYSVKGQISGACDVQN